MEIIATGKRALRRLGLFTLARLNLGDVRIRHHYTGQQLSLHSFKHKGYWYHGRRREQSTMAAFGRLIHSGQCVIEAGGHIGYISMYFGELVGRNGSVHVFEPGPNNLPYVRRNVAASPHIVVVEQALGQEPGRLPMYVEDLTGQNNSLVPSFAGLEASERNAVKAHVIEQMVEVTTVDSYVDSHNLAPDFIKIDVEGFEYEVLSGAVGTLRSFRPILMVEVQSNREDIAAMLNTLGYCCYTASGERLSRLPSGTVNIFCLPQEVEFPSL